MVYGLGTRSYNASGEAKQTHPGGGNEEVGSGAAGGSGSRADLYLPVIQPATRFEPASRLAEREGLADGAGAPRSLLRSRKGQVNLNGISLFTGTAQLDRAAAEALRQFGIDYQPIAYIENNPFAQEIIKARVRDGLIADAPIWPDVVTFPGARFRGYVGAVVAGFPCQPFSVAGKRAGKEDERYLFGEVVRVAIETGAELLLLENVPGLLLADRSGGFVQPAPIAGVVGLLAESGFDCAWLSLGAEDVGAPHGRERWWCLAWRSVADAESAGGRTDTGAVGESAQSASSK